MEGTLPLLLALSQNPMCSSLQVSAENERERERRVFFSNAALQVEKEKPPLNVVGDVHGKIAIMIVSSHVT